MDVAKSAVPMRLLQGMLAVIGLLSTVAAVAGQWCATSECPGCARHGFGPGHGEECFATRDSCESRLREVLSVPHNGITYSGCSERGSTAATGSDLEALRAASAAAAPGHQMDPYINEAISRGISGDISAGDAMGLVGMGMLGNALMSQTDPALQEARRQAAAAAAAEQARQQAIADEERKDRLLGSMLDIGGEQAGGGGLELMMGDEPVARSGDVSAFMPDRTPRTVPNPQPPAVRINPGPYVVPATPPADNPLGLMLGEAAPAPPPPPPPPPDPAQDDRAFNKGYTDGSQCYSSSAGNHCAGAQGNIHAQCMTNYNSGYRNGEALKRILLQQAREAGVLDKAQGRRNGSFTHPMAQGPCRVQWIESYNEGYAGAPPAPMGR